MEGGGEGGEVRSGEERGTETQREVRSRGGRERDSSVVRAPDS